MPPLEKLPDTKDKDEPEFQPYSNWIIAAGSALTRLLCFGF
jgi:hypothetical protein